MSGTRVALSAILLTGYVWLYLVLCALTATPRVALWYPPAIIADSDVLTYRVRVPPHAGNRMVVLAAFDGADRVRSSQEPLTEDGPALVTFERWQLPAGELVLVAALYDAGGEVARDQRPLIVRGKFR